MVNNISASSVPMPTPPAPEGLSADIIAAGQLIPPIQRIRLFSPTEWEEFVEEWATSLKNKYIRIERSGGSGDMGRDVIGFIDDDTGDVWDNYQCKHYDHPLQPGDIWTELGKLIYYTYHELYTYPRKYHFVAPQGAGPSLSRLFRDQKKLKEGLIENWDKHCKTKITAEAEVLLDDAVLNYLNSLDFSIFSYIPPLMIIDGHKDTVWFAPRFGGGLPPRPEPPEPPSAPTELEANYVRALLDAYADHLGKSIGRVGDLYEHAAETTLPEHFYDARLEFYSAEALRAFSRDTLPPGEFEKLQNQIHDGIKDEIRSAHDDGYRRVVATVKTARSLQVNSHPLSRRLAVRDYGGICHQLANDEKVRWI